MLDPAYAGHPQVPVEDGLQGGRGGVLGDWLEGSVVFRHFQGLSELSTVTV